jgi:hypothetical protein
MSRVSVVLSAQGLFHNAIVLSASPRTTTLAAVAAQRSALAEHFGWGGGAESVTVESLNKCSSAQLLEAQIQLNLRGTLVVDGDADQDQKGGGGGGGEGVEMTQPAYGGGAADPAAAAAAAAGGSDEMSTWFRGPLIVGTCVSIRI